MKREKTLLYCCTFHRAQHYKNNNSQKGKIMTIRNYITNFSNAMCSMEHKAPEGKGTIIEKCRKSNEVFANLCIFLFLSVAFTEGDNKVFGYRSAV